MARILVGLVVAIAFVLVGCGTGPAPQPVTEGPLPSGEETARDAGESADEKRAEADRIIYASSRRAEAQAADEAHEQENSQEAPPAAQPAVATIYLDGQGRLLTAQGSPLDVQDLAGLSDEPLEGRGIQLVIDTDAGELPIETLAPLFAAIHEQNAFVDVTTGDAPEARPLDGDDEPSDEPADEPADSTDEE